MRWSALGLLGRAIRERRFETPTWQEPLKQDHNNGQLFRPSWHGVGRSMKCLGWPCPATFFFFAFRDTNFDNWSSCVLKHVMWQHMFQGASKKWTGHLAIFVRGLLGWHYISSLHNADEFQEGRNSCLLLRSCFIGSNLCLVSWNVVLVV